jgi:hypothetical protein
MNLRSVFECFDIGKPIPDTPPQAQKGQNACLLASFERFGAHRPASSKQSSGIKREYERVIRTGDVKAVRALQRLRKPWIANEAHLKAGDLRKLEMLNMLRAKVIKAARETRGLIDCSLEAARGGDRALSDEELQGRLTAREIYSHIKATRGLRVAGDKDAKEIRRLARKLGLRLAKDKRGRKWKWPPRQKNKSNGVDARAPDRT